MQKPTQQFAIPEELLNKLIPLSLAVEERVVGGTLPGYEQFVFALLKPMPTPIENLLHTVVGMSGESGELLDCVKKSWAYNKELDIENLIEELGDLYFYFQGMLNLLGLNVEFIKRINQDKLSKRFPNIAYSDLHAQARLDKQ